jgi:glycerol-3-phosphate dehydrogenase (NAD(P)+)
MKEICVLGGGSFGTALAHLCAQNGHRVRLWMRDPAKAATINQTRRNPRYLKEFDLHPGVFATADLDAAWSGAQLLVCAIPSFSVRERFTVLAQNVPRVPIVLATKGLEADSLMTMQEVLLDVLGQERLSTIMALSGPSFSKEVMLGQPTAVSLACPDEALAQEVAELFFCDHFRAYSTYDVMGVELGGALKNVMAIAAGALRGLGLGHNTRAALVTRGVAEITRVAVAKGADPLTLAGLAGVGDVLLTCTGDLSRNLRIGEALGRGLSLPAAIEEVGEVAEGIETTRAAKALAGNLGVETPIINAVYRVLYENISPQDALLGLVRRKPLAERD